MAHLFQLISAEVDAWAAQGYHCEEHPAIAEIFEWAYEGDAGNPRFLRQPQLQALKTYWWLRLIKATPHVEALYRAMYHSNTELLAGLGLNSQRLMQIAFDLGGVSPLLERIRTDDDLVRQHSLEALRESLTLAYPSYIFALAMGAGKTILIGAIIATEFAMALEYPDGPFVQNALVFAPGTTIIESLRELLTVPYEKILPPRFFRSFAASFKPTFTRDGEKDIPVIRGSSFNVVVTNTEKIRIQKETIRKRDLGGLFSAQSEDEARSEVANLRLQAIASLPHLAIFSDEAHHTYGQSLDTELKKVRKTVDYLADNTNVICVVNTTGTPYYQRQPLRDVVIWYGLSQGIHDGILKDLADNIQAYDFSGNTSKYLRHVVTDFFRDYGNTVLPDGSQAKLAIYFPQVDDLKELRPAIDAALMEAGQSPAVCLVNTSDDSLTKQADLDAFNSLNHPKSPHRVILLVNKGTEGWNCPSLFACALARRLRTSNNFVLQAATRCLRQVPGNTSKARVYLSTENFAILDRQLQETYNESIADLNRTTQEMCKERLVLRKLDIPPLVVTQTVRTVVRKDTEIGPVKLAVPKQSGGGSLTRTTYTLGEQQATASVLRPVGGPVSIEAPVDATDLYAAAVKLAAEYRLDVWAVYDELKRIYSDGEIPLGHLAGLAAQIEQQTRYYEVEEHRVDVALALVKPEGFVKALDDSGAEVYTAEIMYPKDKQHLLLSWKTMMKRDPHGLSFHCSPYKFDSNPEKSFLEQVLFQLAVDPADVQDFFFTGAITDPSKTDFCVQYRDTAGTWRSYTPDFVIRKKPKPGAKQDSGKVLIVEIKSERERSNTTDGENGTKALAMRQWEKLNPDRLKYEMIFTDESIVPVDQMSAVGNFVRES